MIDGNIQLNGRGTLTVFGEEYRHNFSSAVASFLFVTGMIVWYAVIVSAPVIFSSLVDGVTVMWTQSIVIGLGAFILTVFSTSNNFNSLFIVSALLIPFFYFGVFPVSFQWYALYIVSVVSGLVWLQLVAAGIFLALYFHPRIFSTRVTDISKEELERCYQKICDVDEISLNESNLKFNSSEEALMIPLEEVTPQERTELEYLLDGGRGISSRKDYESYEFLDWKYTPNNEIHVWTQI